MTFLLAAPEALAEAGSDLAALGSAITAANAAAAAPTTGLPAAAADEVSTQLAALFSQHGHGMQQLTARLAAFHEQFVEALTSAASTYAAAEANAAQTLANAIDKPAELLRGNPLIGSGAATALLHVTGGVGAPSGTGAQLAPAAMTSAALIPAANALAPIGDAIEAAYLTVEPWAQYGINLLSWAVGYLPLIGILAPQLNYFYCLFQPAVQSLLFNTVDFIDGTVTFSQGLASIQMATTASIDQFITLETTWIYSFFPPSPPLGTDVP
ncbi:MAG: PE family protein [Mycobacterium sp.]|nr:PE family protein [Mycobacterium sp.]